MLPTGGKSLKLSLQSFLIYFKISVVDTKLFVPDLDPAFPVIKDLDPTYRIITFPDQDSTRVSDPSEIDSGYGTGTYA